MLYLKRFKLFFASMFIVMFSLSAFANSLPNIKDVAKAALPAVVNISTTQIVKNISPFYGYRFKENDPFDQFFKNFFNNVPINRKVHALGSGFIISKKGYILTNYHVIRRATTIKVTILNTNDVYDAKVIGTDPKADIALIKIEPKEKLPTLPLGDSNKLQIGDWVVTVGNPFGLNGSVTAGIISAKGRVIGEGPFDHFLQTDAAINPGNSGGPLLNMEGRVIGINTAIVRGGQGIGFAIPINMVKSEMSFLMKGKKIKRGYLGVMIQPLTAEASKELGLNNVKGAIVSQVLKNSAAQKAGIKPGDIIVSINSKPVRSSNNLPYIISSMKPGAKIEIKIIRDKKILVKEVILGTRPSNISNSVQSNNSVYKTKFGFSVSNITPQLVKGYGIKLKKGVVVVSVQPNSFARMVGVKDGDVIVKLNYKPIDNLQMFEKIIKSAKDVIFLHIIRGSTHIFITIQK